MRVLCVLLALLSLPAVARADSPNVCEVQVYPGSIDATYAATLVGSLTSGDIAPATWTDCVLRYTRVALPDHAALLIDAVGKSYRMLMRLPALDQRPREQAMLQAMQAYYLARPANDSGTAQSTKLFAELRTAIDKHKLGAFGSRLGAELLSVVDMENGIYDGRTIDNAVLDERLAAGDEATLLRFMARLPTSALRDEAKRRVIRLRIARSPFAAVRTDKSVEGKLMTTGVNAIELGAHPVTSARLVATGVRGVLALTEAYGANLHMVDAQSDVVATMPLRGPLQLDAQGIDRPITVCGTPTALDPSPCLAPQDLALDSPLASIDAHGAVETHRVDIDVTHALASTGSQVSLPILVGGKPLQSLDWTLRFDCPPDLVFAGDNTTPRGPDITVRVSRGNGRYLFDARSSTSSWFDVVEANDLSRFHLITRGRQGAYGGNGSNGSDTNDDNSPGGDGTAGGDGGNGDDGGDATVVVQCTSDCTAVIETLKPVVLSQGGKAGEGGNGGIGGRGSPGGSDGPAGNDGRPGKPGTVRFVTTP